MQPNRRPQILIAWLVLLAVALAVDLAFAQPPVPPVPPPPAEALVGEWPAETPKISLTLDDEEVGEAIAAIAEKAGWQLAIVAPDELTDRRVTLKVTELPAAAALRVVLETGDLNARLVDGVLLIKAARPERVGKRRGAARIDVPIGDVRVEIEHGKNAGPHGKPGEERTNIGGDVVIKAGEVVEGDAVAIGGSVYVESGAVVEGEVVAIGGSVTLDPGAVVEGAVTAIGGEIKAAEGVIIEGDRVAIGGSFGGLLSSAIGLGLAKPGWHTVLFSLLATALRALTLLVLGLLLITFVPQRIANVQGFLGARPGHSALTGFAVLLGVIPLCILLAVTVIGIPLLPVVALLLAALVVMGLVAFCAWLGQRVPLFAGRKTQLGAMMLGLVVLTLVDLIPVIGTPIVALVGFFAGGAALLSRFGKLTPPPATPTAEAI